MFGDSTFHFCFDDDDNADDSIIVTNQDLPAALDRSHHAVAQAMAQHPPEIPLPLVPNAKEHAAPLHSPILKETIDDYPGHPLVSPIRVPPPDMVPLGVSWGH
jgi:hypothetical protein